MVRPLNSAAEQQPLPFGPISPRPPRQAAKTRRISLALQGGGSFGAFTWGVLDRLLEEDSIGFDAISGASAGSINAVLLASGMADCGRPEARRRLERFWRRMSQAARRAHLVKPGLSLDVSTRILSPYQFNPFDLNPLRDILSEEVDFDALRRASPVRLLVAATRVRDGALRIFKNKSLSLDAVLASACLPLLHHAVSIDGEPYWDGGYAANPPLTQLVAASRSPDVMIVQIIPTARAELPTTSPEIVKRLDQITFNSSLQRDLESLVAMKKLSEEEGGPTSRLGRKLQGLRLHHVSAGDHVDGYSELSAINLDWSFLEGLRDSGRSAAQGLIESACHSARKAAMRGPA
jgi:NTE family protein